jgi:peptide/nickel transport system permease protein
MSISVDDPEGEVALARDVALPEGVTTAEVGYRERRPWVLWLAASWLAITLALALAADWLPIADPNTNVTPTTVPPFHQWPEFLGTDQLGRSVISRLIYGARVSLAVGVAAALCGMCIGVGLGLLAGSKRRAEGPVGVITDSALAIPGIVLLLALSASLGPTFGTPAFDPGVATLVIGLTIFAIPAFTRLSRANTKLVINREYVEASKLLGARPRRWLLREVLPSVLRPVLPYAVVVLAALMVAEASVSFLGLGVVPPTASWGGMIQAGRANLADHPEFVYIPAAVLFITVYSFGLLGRWLRAKSGSGPSKI